MAGEKTQQQKRNKGKEWRGRGRGRQKGAEKKRLSLVTGKRRQQNMGWGGKCGDLAPASGPKIGKMYLHQAFSSLAAQGYVLYT